MRISHLAGYGRLSTTARGSVDNEGLASLSLLKIQSSLCSKDRVVTGDEMNIHVPQSIEAQNELRMLAAAKYNIINPQSSKPNMCIVQDSLLSAYRLTMGNIKVPKEQFFNISMSISITTEEFHQKIKTINQVFKEKNKSYDCFSGHGLFSLILPSDLHYEKRNGINPLEPIVKIFRGVLYEGTLDKSILGQSHNSLILIINKEYGCDRCADFIDNAQFVTNNWLLYSGFTIGLKDCLISDPKQSTKISDVIQKYYLEAETIEGTTTIPHVRELRVIGALGKAKDIGLRIAKESLDPTNNFLSTVRSGSKGDFFNIAQITGLLGQQNIVGKRVNPSLNNNTRTLPHYPFDKLSTEKKYESRGFIAASFAKGLNSREFWTHAMSGREGICDTAMGTARSGYIQRQLIKNLEDVKVQYDGTVRDSTGKIFQYAYGENGYDPANTVAVKGLQQVCDVARLVNRLNVEVELNKK